MYHQSVADITKITTLPKLLRQRLVAEGWQIGRPSISTVFQSADGTERYLIEFEASGPMSETVEAVWMPDGDGGEAGDGTEPEPKIWRRATICVSSQVGCAVNCQFCLTAKLGLQRNLTAGEIAGQVVAVFERHAVHVGRDRVNLVFMGMGEPFLNYDNFMAAVRLLVREVGLSPQRMTVSTSGIVPGIERFATESLDLRPKLAISLNAPNDQVRAEIMPINRKWSIADGHQSRAPNPAASPRARHLRICLARRRHRPTRACPRGCAPGAPHRSSRKSESDRMESRPRHRLHNAETGGNRSVSQSLSQAREFRSTCVSPAAAISSPPAVSSSGQWQGSVFTGPPRRMLIVVPARGLSGPGFRY